MPDCVPQDDRVHFVIAAVEQMDLSMAEVNLRGSGSEQLLPLLEQQVLGFRRFHLRGLAKVETEWHLLCLGYNFERLFNLIGNDSGTTMA